MTFSHSKFSSFINLKYDKTYSLTIQESTEEEPLYVFYVLISLTVLSYKYLNC